MKTLLSGIEVQALFRITKSNLEKSRKEGLPCIMLDGEYVYKYIDLVNFLC